MQQPSDSNTVRGAIWIRPTGHAHQALEDLIYAIRARYGGPGAWPHVSLAGGIERPAADAERKLDQLAARLEPFTIRVDGVGWHDEYYRCVFAKVEPSPELLAAHRAACEMFGQPVEADFEPHISLLYGDVDERIKRVLADALDEGLRLSFEAVGVDFVNATDRLPVEQWRSLYARPLGAA